MQIHPQHTTHSFNSDVCGSLTSPQWTDWQYSCGASAVQSWHCDEVTMETEPSVCVCGSFCMTFVAVPSVDQQWHNAGGWVSAWRRQKRKKEKKRTAPSPQTKTTKGFFFFFKPTCEQRLNMFTGSSSLYQEQYIILWWKVKKFTHQESLFNRWGFWMTAL